MPTRPNLALIVLTLLTTLVSAAEEKRFAARLENGRLIEEDVLRNWYSGNALPQLAGQSLIVGNNPMRWLRDRTLLPGEMPQAYVELFSGDRLPGQTVSHHPAAVEYQADVPEHFTVVPSFPFTRSTNTTAPRVIRVRRQFIRKIVWQQNPALVDRHVPQTVFMNNGREIAYRAIRFSPTSVQLLTAGERLSIPFTEIAELHLATDAPWQLHLQELALLFPGGKLDASDRQRLVQWETTDGLVATTCVQRIDADSRGNNNSSDHWVQGIQPAWSLDMIWVESRASWMRRSWAFDTLPLFRLPFTESRDGAMFSRSGFPARVNRNVLGGPAQSGPNQCGWSLGVMGPSRLTFDLPPLAVGFQTEVAIDHAAHDRGCVRARVYLGGESGPLAESEILVGSDQVAQLEDIRFDDLPDQAQLILEIDAAHDDRPEGADPYDIRDMTNWIEPHLVLDKEKLQARLREITPDTIVAWQGWTVESDLDQLRFVTEHRRVEYPHEAPTWRTMLTSRDQPLELHQRRTISPDEAVLELAVVRQDGHQDLPMVEVRIDGILMLHETVPAENPHDYVNSPPPLRVDLTPFQGAEVEIELTQSASSTEYPVDWRGIHFRPHSSFLRQVLEDPTAAQVEAMQTLDGQPAEVTLRDEAGLVSRPAIEVADGQWVQIAAFDPPLEIRERPLPGQFRNLRFAFAKQGGGRVKVRFLHTADAESPAIYGVGPGDFGPQVVRLDRKELKQEWVVRNEDLFHPHFRQIDITGIAVYGEGGTSCLWDRFYLAGTWGQLEQVTNFPDWEDWSTRRTDWQERLHKAHLQLDSSGQSPQGGILVDRERGLVATPAAADWQPGQTVKLTRHDGQTFTGKRVGFLPEHHLGLVQIADYEPDPAWEPLELSHRSDFERSHVSLIIQRGEEGELQADVARALTWHPQQMLLTRPRDFACQVGAVAIDRDQRVCGFVTQVAPNGQPVIQNAHVLREKLPTP